MDNKEFVDNAEALLLMMIDRTIVLAERKGKTGYKPTDEKWTETVKKALAIAFSKDVGEKKESGDDSVVPMSRELKKDPSHVELICKAFMYDKEWYDGTNMYGPRQHVWKRTVSDSEGHDVVVYSFLGDAGGTKAKEKLFMPTDAEIQAALDEFKKKGWHAQYDRECGYYAVFQGTRALGEHQALYTRNLF